MAGIADMTEETQPTMTWEEAVRWLVEHPDPANRALAHACYFDGEALEAAIRFADSPEWGGVRALLPAPPGRALDLGAGRGISSFALARDGWDVVAVEPDASGLVGAAAIEEIARIADLPIEVQGGKAEALPFEDGHFDVVHCRQALHHAADLKQMCAEALRVLRPGGTFIATREHVLTRRSDLQAFLDSHPLHALYGGENAYTLEEYRAALSAPGPASITLLSPYASVINVFPASHEEERTRLARIAGVRPEEVPDFAFRIRDHFDSAPGRLYSFVVVK